MMAFDFPSSPTTGQTYSVTGGPTYVYNGTAWVVLTPGNQFNRTVFTATAGQTTFTMNYVVSAIDVYRNGVKLAPADFTATNGTSIVLANGCTVGDTVEVISYPMITYTDAVKRTGDTMTGALGLSALSGLTVSGVPVLAGPAFAATVNSAQSIVTSTYVKMQFNTELFDTNNCFDTTNYRFTPNVAGYYQINGSVSLNMPANNMPGFGVLYKNGSTYLWAEAMGSTNAYPTATISALVYFNGTTDYVELYVHQNSGATYSTINSSAYQQFSGFLARAA